MLGTCKFHDRKDKTLLVEENKKTENCFNYHTKKEAFIRSYVFSKSFSKC